MQNKITSHVFHADVSVRSILIGSDPWFFAVDVCKAIALSDTNKAVLGLDQDEIREHEQSSCSGRKPLLINESGLYSLILRSRKPEAKAFKKWVTSEVLPSIRKTGAYNAKQSPPWKIPDSELVRVSGAERDELLRLASLACTYFRYKRKASWWLGNSFANAFGHTIPDTPKWQYTAAHHWLEDVLAKAHQFTDQVDSFERLFWSGVGELSPQASVVIDTKRGIVFHDPVRERRLHAPV